LAVPERQVDTLMSVMTDVKHAARAGAISVMSLVSGDDVEIVLGPAVQRPNEGAADS
jgi:hypothetical protein